MPRPEIKPCPFCGGEDVGLAIEPVLYGDIIRYYVTCNSCTAAGPVVTDSKRAIPLWNERSDEDA